MSEISNKWYVFTGAPSSGKSTTLALLETQGFVTVPEMARMFIEDELARGKTLKEIEPDGPRFEEVVLDMKVEKEATLDPQQLILFDRGIPDTLAYYDLYGWPKTNHLIRACHQSRYRGVFLFEMLDFVQDHARAESPENARKLQNLFLDVYKSAGYDVIFVPKATVEERAEFILSHMPDHTKL